MTSPAEKIVERLGGSTKVAAIVGVNRTQVWRWRREKEAGGTGGLIPHQHYAKLLAYAQEHGIPLTGDDFMPAPAEASQ
jgi:transposase-like protein